MSYAINVEKRAKMLASRNRDSSMKKALLDYYGSYEEMALCGVQSFGKFGYTVPTKNGYGMCFGGPYSDRPDREEWGYTLEDMLGQIAINMFDRRHYFKRRGAGQLPTQGEVKVSAF